MLKHDAIKDSVITLNLINYQMAELARIKEELEARVCALLEHGDDGSKTYTVEKHKVTVKTGYIYSLDKEEYEVVGNLLPECFNPVQKRVSYHLDKQVIRDAERYASSEELVLLSKMISKKPSKLAVSIKAAI
jgi:hypothetical protein